MRRDVHAGADRGRRSARFLLVVLLLAAFMTERAVAIEEDDADPGADLLLADPVDINRATLDELMAIPGMTADLAAELVHHRAMHGPVRSWSELTAPPAELSEANLLAVRPWLFIGDQAIGRSAAGSASRTATPTRTWDDVQLRGRTGRVAAVVRARRLTLPGFQSELATSLALRAEPRAGLSLQVGDVAPIEGMGLVLGLRGAFGGAAPSGRHPSDSSFDIEKPEDLERWAPVPGSRSLRAALLDIGGHATLGAFDYRAAFAAATVGDSVLPVPRWYWGILRLGDARDERRPGASCQVASWQGRPWISVNLAAPLGSGSGRLEVARDPDGALRRSLRLLLSEGRRLRAELHHVGGHRAFVSPLGFDSERSPVSADHLATGRNGNVDATTLILRARLSRPVVLTGQLAGRTDPAGTRRSWDRPVGLGVIGIEVTPAPRWGLVGDIGLESRGAPGPSAVADAPERRYTGRLKASWEGRRGRLRFDWSGRMDVVGGSAGTERLIRSARDLLSIRGRWRGSKGSWIGGGMARFDMPSSSSALLFEERSAGLNGSVTVHGRGHRWHLAAGFVRGPLELALVVAEEVVGGEAVKRSSSAAVRWAVGGSDR